jgi:hypothetical protein
MLLVLSGCGHGCDPRIHVELHDIPEDKSSAQTSRKIDPPACPPGDPPGNIAASSPVGGHKVTLSWNASTSIGSGKDIRYCLYRTVGGPVQRKPGIGSASPCANCQQVTSNPITGTTYHDVQVENGVHYCYAAIAIDMNSRKVSDFSNQADAVIPPRKEPPFCTPKNTNKAHGNHSPATSH